MIIEFVITVFEAKTVLQKNLLTIYIDDVFYSLLFIVNIAAVQEQRNASAAGIDSTVGESSPPEPSLLKHKTENFEPLGINLQQVPIEGDSLQPPFPTLINAEFHIEEGVEAAPNVEEHQFIPSCPGNSLVHNYKQENPELENLWALRNTSEEEMSVSLQLGKPEPKRRKQGD